MDLNLISENNNFVKSFHNSVLISKKYILFSNTYGYANKLLIYIKFGINLFLDFLCVFCIKEVKLKQNINFPF